MRYLFSGLMRDTGMPVEGHIEAVDVDIAYDMLSGHGVVASSVVPDPKPLNIHEELPDAPADPAKVKTKRRGRSIAR